MKQIQTSFLRALIAVVVGAFLIKYRQEMVIWLTVCIGVLFFLSGLISCIVYFVGRKAPETSAIDEEGRPLSSAPSMFPLVGMGSLVLGAALALFPGMIEKWTVYIFGALLLLGAVGQYVSLATIVKLGRLHPIYWLMPSVVFIIGLISIFKPEWMATSPLFFIGWTMILYGIIECIDAFKIMNLRRRIEKLSTEKQVEETAKESETDGE